MPQKALRFCHFWISLCRRRSIIYFVFCCINDIVLSYVCLASIVLNDCLIYCILKQLSFSNFHILNLSKQTPQRSLIFWSTLLLLFIMCLLFKIVDSFRRSNLSKLIRWSSITYYFVLKERNSHKENQNFISSQKNWINPWKCHKRKPFMHK